jgi:hypothetical protein
VAPTGRFPTDQTSLISMGAVVGTILVAVILGVFISGLNPTDPSVGLATPSPSPSAEATPEPSVEPVPSDTPAPTAVPTPVLRGTLAFGTDLDGSGMVTGATNSFTPSTNFAYSLSVPGGIGGTPMRNEISRTTDPAEVVLDDPITVDPASELVAYRLGSAAGFIQDWGPGEYIWRIYVGEELVAQAPFILTEG